MSRRSRRRSTRREQRDTVVSTNIAPRSGLLPILSSPVSPVFRPPPIGGDLRRWSPYPASPALLRRSSAAYTVRREKSSRQTKAPIAFSVPRDVGVCVRRAIRRRVVFAAGVGGSRQRKRPPRRNQFSGVKC